MQLNPAESSFWHRLSLRTSRIEHLLHTAVVRALIQVSGIRSGIWRAVNEGIIAISGQ